MKTTVEAKWREFEQAVQDLTPAKRTAFATFVASRAARYYLEYCGNRGCPDPKLTSDLLEMAWRVAEVGGTKGDPTAFRNRLEAVAEQLDSSADSSGAAAQEACFACIVLCEILAGENDAKQTMRVVSFLRDITDMIVQDRAALDANTDQLEADILCHSLMTDELAKVSRALDAASAYPPGGELVAQLRGLS